MKINMLSVFLVLYTFGVVPSSSANSEIHTVRADSSQETVSNGQIQPPVKFATIWADDEGATHISHCRFEGLQFKSYAPPAAPQWIGLSSDDVESIAYAVLPPGYIGSWHTAPGPQWVITLSGKWAVETTDGDTLIQGPGEIQFNADTSSRPRKGDHRVGHMSRTVGDEPNIQLIIKLKSSTNSTGKCEK